MSAGLTHHAAIALGVAASRVGELGSAIDRGEASLEFVRIRLDGIRQTLERDAREYEHMAASEYVDGSAKLTDRAAAPSFYHTTAAGETFACTPVKIVPIHPTA